MTTAQFFENFDLFAGAPDAVAKMRSLILVLAVRGQLTSASFRPSASSDPSANPFPIPQDWRWVTLQDAAETRAAAKISPSAIADNAWVLDLEDIDGATGRVLAKATFAERRSQSTKAAFVPGDVLYGKLRPYLNKVVIAQAAGFCTTEIIPLRPRATIMAEFLKLFLRSPHFLKFAEGKSYGMKMPRLGTKDLESAPVPLPLIAEQKRIVAKVDELMALCDQLEAQQQERETKHTALAQATLARFAEAPTPTNLNLLFHSSFSIQSSDLRKTILTLAVQGKLVRQDPKDEAAVISLSKCGVDVKRWSVGDRDRRQEIPSSWTWIRFAGVGDQRLGKMLDAQKNRGKLKPYLRNTNVQWMRFELDDVKEMRVEEREEDELRLRKGDLLICEGGEPGRCAIWREESEEMYFQKALHRVRPCEAVLSEFLALNLQIDCRNEVLAGYFTGATIKHLTGRSLAEYPIPLPPLAEQKRIVAKVEELMALVDALEAQQAAADQAATHLLDAVVSELAAAA